MRKTRCSTFEHRWVNLPSVCFSCSFNLSERMVYSRSSSSMTLRTFSTCIRSRSYIEQETIRRVLFAINRCSPYWCDHDSCDSYSRFDVRVSSCFLRAKPSWTCQCVFSVEISMLTSTRFRIMSFNSWVICSMVSFNRSTVACSSVLNWETRSLPNSDCKDSSLAQNCSIVAWSAFNCRSWERETQRFCNDLSLSRHFTFPGRWVTKRSNSDWRCFESDFICS